MQTLEHTVGSGEVALWRAVIVQALQDAVAVRRTVRDGRPSFLQDAVAVRRTVRDGRPSFASQENEKAREWFGRAGANFSFVCDCADLSESAVAAYAEGLISGGGWRRPARRTVA